MSCTSTVCCTQEQLSFRRYECAAIRYVSEHLCGSCFFFMQLRMLHGLKGCMMPWILPMTEVYLLFYQSALQTFVDFNKFLQRANPLIPIICDQMNAFITKLASKLLPVAAIKAAKGDLCTLIYIYKEKVH